MDDIEDDRPSPEFLQGIEEFNAREFFECHETLELVWRKQTSEKREFTQGIIQAAVAYYHLERSNRAGAIKLFHRALPRLLKFAPVCFQIDVLPLADAVGQTLAILEASSESTKNTSLETVEQPVEEVLPAPPTIKISLS